MAERDLKRDRPELHPSARSSARLGLGEVDIIAPGVLHVRLAGSLRIEHIAPLMTAGDAAMAEGYELLVAVDADDVHAYKAEVRRVMQSWMFRNRGEIESVWCLFRSPLIKMGIGLVNAVTGGMVRGFRDPLIFDEALNKAARAARDGSRRRGQRADSR